MSTFNGPATAIEDNRNKLSAYVENPEEQQYYNAQVINEQTTNSKNLFANAIKKTVSGTEEIVIRDVSPIEHTLKCKVSNNKELWPRLTPCQYVKVNDDGTFNIQSEHGFACECDSLVLPAGTYTTSGSVYTYVTDRTGSFYYKTPATLTLEEETTINIGVNANEAIDVKNQYFRLEEGTVATPYITDFSAVEVSVYGEDGLKQTVTANADGSVEGLMSVAPVMSLMCSANGVNMDVEYIADTKNYVDTAIGEIDTALDGIIAIQNSLIGGEGV